MPDLPRWSCLLLLPVALLLGAGCADPAPAGDPVGAGVGLEAEGGALHLAPAHRLPQDCQPNQRAEWDAAQGTWVCGAPTRAGTGLVREGDALALADAYRLPQGCATGELPIRTVSGWACASNAGDGDTLASLSCAAAEVPKWDGAGWSCAPDADTRLAAGTGLDMNGNVVGIRSGYRLPQSCGAGQVPRWDGTDWNCSDDIDTDTDTDTLATLFCEPGGIPKWSGTAWGCAPDEDTPVVAGTGLLADGDRISLDPAYELPQACATGQVPKWAGSTWTCADDIDTDTDTDTDTLATLACAAGAVPSWDGSTWTCGTVAQVGAGLVESGGALAIGPTYRLPQTCANGEVARWNGVAWDCATRGTITGVVAGPGLTGGATTGVATLELDLAFTDDRYQARSRRVVLVPPAVLPEDSGAALVAALAAIAQAVPTATDPWLIRLEPGVYDIEAAKLVLPPFVGIEGAGADFTVIRGTAPSVIEMTGVGNTELRQLAVEQDAAVPPAGQIVRAISVSGSRRLRLVDLRVVSTTSVAQHITGVHSNGAHVILESSDIEAVNTAGTGYATALSAQNGRMDVRGGRFEASASVEAAGGTLMTSGAFDDATFTGTAYDGRGVQTTGQYWVDLKFRNTSLSGTTALVFRPTSGVGGTFSIEGSRLEGSVNAMDISSGTVEIAFSRLIGAVTTANYGRAHCVLSAGATGALGADCL